MMMSLSIILFVICIILLIIISMSSISYTKNYVRGKFIQFFESNSYISSSKVFIAFLS